jgi:hypothetical protein
MERVLDVSVTSVAPRKRRNREQSVVRIFSRPDFIHNFFFTFLGLLLSRLLCRKKVEKTVCTLV